MILRNILIELNGSHIYEYELPMGEDSEADWFGMRGCVLGYFLSQRLTALKFKEGDYGQINICGVSGTVKDYIPKEGVNSFNIMVIKCSFDKDYYRSLKTDKDYGEYYIKLYKEGIENILVRTDQPVPKKELFEWMDEFRAAAYVNQWQFKKRLFRDIGLQVAFDCKMTIEAFNLTFRIYRYKSKELLFEKMILETKPDPFYFQKEYKDAVLEGNTIKVIGRKADALENPLFEMDISEYLE